MGQASEKRRSQRFVLDNENYRKGRFSPLNWLKSKRILKVQVYDLSKEGISFLVSAHQIPQLGSKIGVEFSVPSGEQIACFGRVMRVSELPVISHGSLSDIESQVSTLFKVGVQFQEMPVAYGKMLTSDLKLAAKNRHPNMFSLNFVQNQFNNLGISVKATLVPRLYNSILIWVFAILTIYGMGLFAVKMQDIAKTKWWLKEAHSFSQHMHEVQLKEDEELKKDRSK